MKKLVAISVVLFVFAVSVPFTVNAQTCRSNRNYRSSYNSNRNYSNRNYRSNNYNYRRPSYYQRNRNIINIGIGTGGGALIGGILGGRRGAGYGALIGAGSGALYTYVIKPKRQRYYRRY